MSSISIAGWRSAPLERLESEQFDLVIVGGGATGLGVAVDASLRGLKVALIEAHDFAKGTSSRATKLIHGGVRYLAQGRVGLVRESLRERSSLLRNAPHLVNPLTFVVPLYQRWELPFYGAGLSVYGALAGRHGLGPTRLLSAREVQQKLPGVRRAGLKGGIEYWDAQFDDARLAIALARTADDLGATVLNYAPVTGLVHEAGKVKGVYVHDQETDSRVRVQARCVINATGVWVDSLRETDAKAGARATAPMIEASRGSHLVLDRNFFPSDNALLIPRTPDDRVLFVIPWQGKVLVGTTDVGTTRLDVDPVPDAGEVDYILKQASSYLQTAITRKDVKSLWSGLRPLVRPNHGADGNGVTSTISREHTIEISPSGLVTVAGGKWTTYRAMAQDVLETCVNKGLLPTLPACRTHNYMLAQLSASPEDKVNITDEFDPLKEIALQDAGLTRSMIYAAVRYEYARTVEDVLARRSRLLFLNAEAAKAIAPVVAELLQQLTGTDPQLSKFTALAKQYRGLTD